MKMIGLNRDLFDFHKEHVGVSSLINVHKPEKQVRAKCI